MDDAKNKRAGKARILSRRVKELQNAIRMEGNFVDVKEKMANVKGSFEELGVTQDGLMELVDETDETATKTQEKWYDDYDIKVNAVITEAREYLRHAQSLAADTPVPQVKIQKLKIPVFESMPRKYLKWKGTFERYTRHLSEEIKYDYLLESTKGVAHEFVENRSTYAAALEKLDKEYGNKNLIMNLLIGDIKLVSVVRKGDFRSFEKLSYVANEFRDRLLEMGLGAEAENSYVLQELESKLNAEDTQRWLESMGENVDDRRVEHMVKWLESQTKLRRISNSKYTTSDFYVPSHAPRKVNTMQNTFVQKPSCCICQDSIHDVASCPVFISWSLNEKWEFVKRCRLCFLCMTPDHRRNDCKASRCQFCNGPHHSLLHSQPNSEFRHVQISRTSHVNGIAIEQLNLGDNATTMNNNTLMHMGNANTTDHVMGRSPPHPETVLPARCFLPIVKSTLINGDHKVSATTLLDSGSELHVMSSKLCKKLRLTGSPIFVNIVGVGGQVSQRRTKRVEVVIEDRMGSRTPIECIVLDETCGKALEIDARIFLTFGENVLVPRNEIFSEGGDVELLLGMASPHLHQQISLCGKKNGLTIMETRFGPSLVGPAPANFKGNYDCSVFNLNNVNLVAENEYPLKFYEAEISGIKEDCSCQLKTETKERNSAEEGAKVKVDQTKLLVPDADDENTSSGVEDPSLSAHSKKKRKRKLKLDEDEYTSSGVDDLADGGKKKKRKKKKSKLFIEGDDDGSEEEEKDKSKKKKKKKKRLESDDDGSGSEGRKNRKKKANRIDDDDDDDDVKKNETKDIEMKSDDQVEDNAAEQQKDAGGDDVKDDNDGNMKEDGEENIDDKSDSEKEERNEDVEEKTNDAVKSDSEKEKRNDEDVEENTNDPEKSDSEKEERNDEDVEENTHDPEKSDSEKEERNDEDVEEHTDDPEKSDSEKEEGNDDDVEAKSDDVEKSDSEKEEYEGKDKPNDLLRPGGLIHEPPELNQGNPKSRYEYIQRLTEEWWKLWLRHFVPNLQPRSKWSKLRENLEQGDIVLLIDPEVKRGKWQMGTITETYVGHDGNVRSVRVKTQTGSYDRPITNLSLLLSKAEFETEK